MARPSPAYPRQGDDGNELERASLLRASARKSCRDGRSQGAPKEPGTQGYDNSARRIVWRSAAMKEMNKRSCRCAIYTRVSTDQGLEQDFNSLDAQREASEAYIKSQAHEGWRMMRDRYDDGGYSGGSMDRPGFRSCSPMSRLGGST
jgi:hypothetical protein